MMQPAGVKCYMLEMLKIAFSCLNEQLVAIICHKVSKLAMIAICWQKMPKVAISCISCHKLP